MTLLNEADAVYLGTLEADAVYLGAEKVWPSGFDPNSIAGLMAWHDASQLALADNAAVNSWPDLSAAGHHMGARPDYGVVPIYKTNALNGRGVVRYNGVNTVLTAAVGPPVAYIHFFIVAKYNQATFDTYDGLITNANSDLILVGEGTGGQAVWYNPGPGTTYHYNGVANAARPAPMMQWACMSISRSPGLSGALQIGLDRVHTPRYWDGDVAEILIYDRVLSDAERTQIEDYLRGKWGLP